MDKELIQQAIMNITSELDKLSAFMHLDRKEGMESEKENEEEDPISKMLNGESEEEPEEEEEEEEEEEMPESMDKKPLKIDFLAIKKGKKGAFA